MILRTLVVELALLALLVASALGAQIDRITHTVSTTGASGASSSASTSTTQSPTLVWVTPSPGTAAVQTPYSQKFSSFYDTVATPKSGSIGLGSISGKIGVVKPTLYVED